MIYKLITIFLYSVFFTYASMPYVLQKLKEYGYVGKDQHKKDKRPIPNMGGVAIFAGVMVSLSLAQLLLSTELTGKLFIFYFVVIVYALFGLLDDIFHFKRRYDKIAVLLVMSLPIASIINHTDILGIDFGTWYLYVIAPMYIMVVANLVNIHAGFNGLGPGTTFICLLAAGVKSYMMFGLENLMYLLPILGALLVFMFYNWYPAKVFDGNIGAFMMGGALGAFLIINRLEVFGVIILIPNIITFVLDTWVLAVKKVPDKEWPSIKADGTLVPDKTVRFKSFKFALISLFPMNEKQATKVCLLITTILCVVAVVWL